MCLAKKNAITDFKNYTKLIIKQNIIEKCMLGFVKFTKSFILLVQITIRFLHFFSIKSHRRIDSRLKRESAGKPFRLYSSKEFLPFLLQIELEKRQCGNGNQKPGKSEALREQARFKY